MKAFFKSKFINRYSITIVIGVLVLALFDQYSWYEQAKNRIKISSLEKELSYYKEEIRKNQEKLDYLNSSDENLERFAREECLMKRTDEDIFIIEE